MKKLAPILFSFTLLSCGTFHHNYPVYLCPNEKASKWRVQRQSFVRQVTIEEVRSDGWLSLAYEELVKDYREGDAIVFWQEVQVSETGMGGSSEGIALIRECEMVGWYPIVFSDFGPGRRQCE